MTAMVAEDLAQIPMSPFLVATLQRAAQYAEAQAHREVTLEHVLLALAEDPEATVILRSSNIDIARLQSDVSNYLGNIADRQDPRDSKAVVTSVELQRILEAAAEAAKQGQRREINGAILLAAIVGDGASTAAHILRAQGLTFDATIAALRNAAQQSSAEAAPAIRPDGRADGKSSEPQTGQVAGEPVPSELSVTADPLAEARERVGQRRQQSDAPPASIEPQWEQVAPQPDARNDDPFGSITSDDHDVSEAGGAASVAAEPIPAGIRPPASEPADSETASSHWAPSQGAAKPDRATAPRLQRVPPPLPPDAGLRPPRSESFSAAPPVPQPGLGAAAGQGAGSAVPPPMPDPASPPGARPPHIPPWVGGETGSARGRAPGPPASPAPAPQRAQPHRPRSTQINVETGQLVENIPRRMKTGVTELVEVRIARAEVKALAKGLQGGGAAYQHDLLITKAMSVKLRAPDGGFWVEAASPETQWIENVLGVMTDDFASWRWSVTPKSSGRKKLQLVVSARTVGTDGLAAETALPDQLFEIRVGINYGQSAKRLSGWLVAAIIGGVLARFGETAFDAAKGLISKMSGL